MNKEELNNFYKKEEIDSKGKKILIMRVKPTTYPKSLAYSILLAFENGNDEVHLMSIGAGSCTQAIKARIIFRGIAATKGVQFETTEYFVDVPKDPQFVYESQDEMVSAINIKIKRI